MSGTREINQKTQHKLLSSRGKQCIGKDSSHERHDDRHFSAAQVKDPVLSQKWPGSLLWDRFNPCCGNFHMLRVQPKKKQARRHDKYHGRGIKNMHRSRKKKFSLVTSGSITEQLALQPDFRLSECTRLNSDPQNDVSVS